MIEGSLYVHAWGDIPTLEFSSQLTTVTGGLFCSGDGDNYTTSTIAASGLRSIFSNESSPVFLSIGLVISDYQNLSTLSFPALTAVESNLVLARNPLLRKIDGLQSLATVNGNLDITGNFDVLDLPSLRFVNGFLNVKSSSSAFQCSQLNESSVIVTGAFSCEGNVFDPQPLAADNSTTNATAAAPSTSTSVTPTTPTSSSSSPPTSSSSSSRTSEASRDIWVSGTSQQGNAN